MNWRNNGTTWGDITKESENANQGVEEHEELKEICEENIISAVINRRDNAPSVNDFVPLTKQRSIGERRDGRQNAQDARNFLTMQKGSPR